MTAAWNVLGKAKKTVDEVAASKHLDPEVLQRWVDYLAQASCLSLSERLEGDDGLARQHRRSGKGAWPTHSRSSSLRVRSRRVRRSNSRTTSSRPRTMCRNASCIDTKPSKFDTFDEFCPGCELELKALPTFEAKLYPDIFVTQSGDLEEKFMPGVLVFIGWCLTRRSARLGKLHRRAAEKDRRSR